VKPQAITTVSCRLPHEDCIMANGYSLLHRVLRLLLLEVSTVTTDMRVPACPCHRASAD